MFRIFAKKKSASESGLKRRLGELKCRKLSFEDTDLAELEQRVRQDAAAVLSLKPVNYYAVKNNYILANIYTSEDYSENYILFKRIAFEKKTGESDIFPLEGETVVRLLAKVGIMISLPDDG